MYKLDHSGNMFQVEINAISKRWGTATVKKKQAAFFAPFPKLCLWSHINPLLPHESK